MTPTEAAALLTVCAAYDNRKPDADQAKAWSLALDGLRFEDCRNAVVGHYQRTREWIMPSDVIAAVRKVRAARIAEDAPSPPPGLDPDDTGSYARWLGSVRRATADGRDLEMPEYRPTRQIGELRNVLRALPAAPAKPDPKTAERQAAVDKAREDLASRPTIPVAEPLDEESA